MLPRGMSCYYGNTTVDGGGLCGCGWSALLVVQHVLLLLVKGVWQAGEVIVATAIFSCGLTKTGNLLSFRVTVVSPLQIVHITMCTTVNFKYTMRSGLTEYVFLYLFVSFFLSVLSFYCFGLFFGLL